MILNEVEKMLVLKVPVDDIDKAAQVLVKRAWEPCVGQARISNAVVRQAQHRLAHPSKSKFYGSVEQLKTPSIVPPVWGVIETVLLRALDWGFTLHDQRKILFNSDESTTTDNTFFPSLP